MNPYPKPNPNTLTLILTTWIFAGLATMNYKKFGFALGFEFYGFSSLISRRIKSLSLRVKMFLCVLDHEAAILRHCIPVQFGAGQLKPSTTTTRSSCNPNRLPFWSSSGHTSRCYMRWLLEKGDVLTHRSLLTILTINCTLIHGDGHRAVAEIFGNYTHMHK